MSSRPVSELLLPHTVVIASCGLRLDNESVRVAVHGSAAGEQRLRSTCVLFGTQIDARGSHAFICIRAPGRIARHQALNDMVARAFASAGIPVTKEFVGWARQDVN